MPAPHDDRLAIARQLLEAHAAVVSAVTRLLDNPPAPPVYSPANFQGCPREILDTLRAVGHRLTGTQLTGEMAKRGFDCSETVVKTTAAAMVNMGVLTNEQDRNPRGYGLPEWGAR